MSEHVPEPAMPPPGRGARILLPGAAGVIEAEVAVPDRPAQRPGFAVICHPHPLFGGAMTHKVPYTLAATALRHGLVALRFNFRGVGRSSGKHDGGVGETEDTLAVIAWLRRQMPEGDLLLGGFSFGAFVSLQAAARARPRALVSIAPPFRYFAEAPRPPRPECPWLVVHGTDDEVVAYEETRRELQHYDPPPELLSPSGVGHFFHGRLAVLQDALGQFLVAHWSE